MVCRAQRWATGGKDVLLSCPRATFTSTEDFCFYTGRQFEDRQRKEEGGGVFKKKKTREESKDAISLLIMQDSNFKKIKPHLHPSC